MHQFSALVSSKNCKNFNMQERVPLYSAGDAAPLANVNLYFITAQLILSLWHWKRKRAATYPYSWATKWKGGFQGFPWRNELYTVSFCLEHSLAGDCHIWWVRKVRYSNPFKSLQNYQLQLLMKHGSVSDLSWRKRDLYLMLRVVSFLWRWGQKISNKSLSN